MPRDYVLKSFRSDLKLRIDYAGELNEQQHAAVTALPGPALVIAGAGSGKTRTLIYRVAFLLEQGIPPDRMLLLTFTNKAAREMMQRVSDLLGRRLPELWGGTFHSIGNRILRHHFETLGLRRNFTIMDQEDSRDLMRACVADAKIDLKANKFPKPEVLLSIISLAVNKSVELSEIVEEQFDHFTELTPRFLKIQDEYAKRKQAMGVVDFDDMLVYWLKLLTDHEEIRQSYQERFQFLLVDEYQDTNKIQGRIIDLLAERHQNVMAVGDDAQSIYSWRGAHFKNILEFPERYPKAKVYRIETNYRSTPEILALANACIAHNAGQFQKCLEAAKPSGAAPIHVRCHDSYEQASFISQRVSELTEQGTALDEIAVLYRSHFHAMELQLELTRSQIPFSITSGIRFFEQAHVKDATSYVKLLHNPADEIAFKRLACMIQGIGARGAEKLWLNFSTERAKAAGAVSGGGRVPVAPPLQACAQWVPGKSKGEWAQFTATMAQLEDPAIYGNPAEMIDLVLDAGYEDYLKANYKNAASRMEDLVQLAVFAETFEDLEDFLTQLALQTNMEAEESQRSQRKESSLKLSSIHQAKGLEFKAVFVIMLCQGMFPSHRSLTNPDALEEERRLFYVAVTRARDELYLSHPAVRMSANRTSQSFEQPSQFLMELPENVYDEWQLKSSAYF